MFLPDNRLNNIACFCDFVRLIHSSSIRQAHRKLTENLRYPWVRKGNDCSLVSRIQKVPSQGWSFLDLGGNIKGVNFKQTQRKTLSIAGWLGCSNEKKKLLAVALLLSTKYIRFQQTLLMLDLRCLTYSAHNVNLHHTVFFPLLRLCNRCNNAFFIEIFSTYIF